MHSIGLARSYKEIVQRYREMRLDGHPELDCFRAQPSLGEALRLAGLAQNQHGQVFSHQYRVPRAARAAAANALESGRRRVARAGSFHDLMSTVKDLLGGIAGIGPLTLYDTSVRIGAYLGILPDRVYLHAGVRDGATALGFPKSREWLDLAELPAPFQVLKPHEAEDVLCIFRDDLAALSSGRRRPSTRALKPGDCAPAPRRRERC